MSTDELHGLLIIKYRNIDFNNESVQIHELAPIQICFNNQEQDIFVPIPHDIHISGITLSFVLYENIKIYIDENESIDSMIQNPIIANHPNVYDSLYKTISIYIDEFESYEISCNFLYIRNQCGLCKSFRTYKKSMLHINHSTHFAENLCILCWKTKYTESEFDIKPSHTCSLKITLPKLENLIKQ